MGEEVKVDAALFGSRLGKLYKHWQEKKDELWAGSRAVVVLEGASSDDLRMCAVRYSGGNGRTAWDVIVQRTRA
eukprot:1144109-Pelagomonas_calceolata.AAC.5